MAEVKNSFLKSKMNQDLDDRLLPNGEYRYALNISVGKSEADDIGTLQNVLGNERLPLTNYNDPTLECIGEFMDNQNNRIFQFLTNYNDPDPSKITLPTSGTMMIAVYDLDSPLSYTVLVQGLFLNFAKNKEYRITGVNLIEGLLFWTDNRNQPRKININKALGSVNYYTTEEQISVAKYSPVDSITMYRKVTTTADSASVTNTIDVTDAAGITPGMTLITEDITGADFCTVVSVVGTTITFYKNLPSTIADGTKLTFLSSTMSDQSSKAEWPGDPDFLEDKYVRFSYRFKFDDNEYSLMAPFTQIAYIPKQKGYFIDGNETDAYRSTVLNWFENYINNIELIIPLPDRANNIESSYKIKEIDILYKESDSLAVKVVETVNVSIVASQFGENNFYIQTYQSQRPYKTLPEDQTVRVYDKVPVRARAQESAGNRIIYGNYYSNYTPPSTINYNISVQPKSSVGTNFIEYPNHTLKKNRNYQVGFVLGDKYSRQSPVILSPVTVQGLSIGADAYAKGSTIYSGYNNSILFEDVKSWFGDALIMYVNTIIDSERNIPAGTPGLYAVPTNVDGFAITAFSQTGVKQYNFTMNLLFLSSQYVPEPGQSLRGKYTDYVKVLTINKVYQTPGNPNTPIVSFTITTSDDISDVYSYSDPGGGLPDIKFAYTINPIGWYSYKVVVRQQEQDYYNVYLPGMLDGYPKGQTFGSQVVYNNTGEATLQNGINVTQFPVSETGNTSHIVLINDNINKIPRDLSEVGPDQKQYRSSVQLYGRVENTEKKSTIVSQVPPYSAKVNSFTYLVSGNPDWAIIKPGDGIQSVQANVPVQNASSGVVTGGTSENPYKWIANTVVVSNEVNSSGVGTIVFSPSNYILLAAQNPIPSGTGSGNYDDFEITRAENIQYFPSKKADVVTAIANAADFNFIDNSEENITGTAGINFYQLQNKPLIGRISTVSKIGVIAQDMIPFLSVYETRADESLLELFWETATTGLISDLNSDVLTGFNGPVGFGDFEYIHYEDQDWEGVGTVAGAADSKFVTPLFYVKDQSNSFITNVTLVLDDVLSGSGSRLSNFGIQTIPPAGLDPTFFRIFIKNPFVFTNQAEALESYQFNFTATDYSNPLQPIIVPLTVNGRLRNSSPTITTVASSYNITQATENVVDLDGNNGSEFGSPNNQLGLKWSITSGNTSGYFSINQETGLLKLINSNAPLGAYTLTITLEDAVDTLTWLPITPLNTDYTSRVFTKVLTINIGDEPVPYTLRPLYNGCFLTPGSDFNPYPVPLSPPAPLSQNRYGIVYLGPKQIFYNSSNGGVVPYLPTIPGSGGYYGAAENPEQTNFPSVVPQGLTEGEYRISVDLIVPVPQGDDPFGIPANTTSIVSIYLYRRIYTEAGTNTWELVKTTNNIDTPYTTMSEARSNLEISPPLILKRTTLKITSQVGVFYEWAVGIKMYNDLQNTVGGGPYVEVHGEDANYTYDQITPNYTLPITTAYKYNTGVQYLGQPQGIPWQTLDATRGLDYSSLNNFISDGTLNPSDSSIIVELTTVNNQLTPGLTANLYDTSGGLFLALNTIAAINVTGDPKKILVQLFTAYTGSTPVDLSGYKFKFETSNVPETLGEVYSATKEGTEIKRLYKDNLLTQKWIPPVANNYYVFRVNPSTNDYDPSDNGDYTKYPFFCAKINASGEVVNETGTIPNVQTAWQGPTDSSLVNRSFNILYDEPFIP